MAVVSAMELSRRRLLAAAGPTLAAGLSGCVATEPTVEADLPASVFQSVTPAQSISWGARGFSVAISLSAAATTDRKVRRVVATSGGTDYWSGRVRAGQTRVSGFLPVGTESRLLAVDADDDVVETVAVRVVANTIP